MANNARPANYAPPNAGYKGQHMVNSYNQNGQGHGSAHYLPRGVPMSSPGDHGLQGLTSNMAALNMHASYGSSATSKSASSALSGGSSEFGNIPLSQGQGLWVPNQHVLGGMYQMVPGNQQQANMTPSPNMYSHGGAYVPQAAYQYGQAVVDNSPMAPAWAARLSSGEMPSLMTPRRDSISSNENDIPGTPYGSNGMYRYGAGGATIMDRSPSALFTSSATPSPSQLSHPYQVMAPMQKQQTMPTLPPQLLALVHQEPPIPRAIPAPSSPHKPLDRSLENKTGETNVYIRGLLPETTDEMLHAWGKRFGDIQSSKSIIDNKTFLCKGQVMCSLLAVTSFTDGAIVSALSSTTTLKMPRTASVAFTTLDTKLALLGYLLSSFHSQWVLTLTLSRNRSTPNSRSSLTSATLIFTFPTSPRT